MDAGQTAHDRITLSKMRVRSKKSADRGTPDETGSGKDLENFTGFAHSRISAHFHAARTGYSTTTYDPIAAFLPKESHDKTVHPVESADIASA